MNGMPSTNPTRPRSRGKDFATGCLALALIFVAATAISAGLWTWIIMLVLGATGNPRFGYWDTFPFGVLVTLILASINNQRNKK